MQGESFINPCFWPINERHPLLPYTRKLPRMSSCHIYEDPKLNARCLVVVNKLDLTLFNAPQVKSLRKPRVFKVSSDSEEEEKNDVSVTKKRGKRRIKGTKRLLQLSDSEEDEDEDGNNETTDSNLSNPRSGSLPKKLATTSSKFVVEKSVSTPEGKRLLKSTVSSKDSRTEEINSLTHFRLCQVEEITLSSDDEEEVFSNTSNLALTATSPANKSPEANKEEDENLSQDSDTTDDDESTVSVPSTVETREDPRVVEENAESSQEIENADEKLRALVASHRSKPKGKSIKPTSPRSNYRGWRATKTEPSKKASKVPTLEKTMKEQQGLSGYAKSCSEAYKKNALSTTAIALSVPVYAAASGRQKPLPVHSPRVPLPTPVKAKTTAVSRGDLFAADLLDSGNQPKIQKKELPRTPRIPKQIPTKHLSNNNLLKKQPVTKITFLELPENDELISDASNGSAEYPLPSNSCRQRVSRIPSSEITSGPETSRNLSANSENEDRGKQLTARTKANLALKTGISHMKRAYDVLQGQRMKMVRVDGKSKTDVIERPFKIKTFRHIPSCYGIKRIGEQRFNCYA